MKTSLAFAAALLAASAAVAQTNAPAQTGVRSSSATQTPAALAAQVPAPKPEDVKSPEALVAACYDVISGAAGPRNWDRFRSLFLPAARLTASSQKPDGSHAITLLSVGDYVQLAGAGFLKSGFYEQGIHNELRTFGNMGQMFSSYESRRAPADAPFQRGVNSFQMLYDGQRWWIVSILWDDERKDNPLPPELLKK
jgi:hypothetical protein